MSSFDVFISYNSKNRNIVELFVKELATINMHPFIDIWDLTPGKPWQEEIENILINTNNIAIFIGENGLGRWQNEEMRIALDLRTNFEINVIPVLLPGAKIEAIPPFLKRLTWVDFREGLDNKTEYNKFIKSLGLIDYKEFDENIFYDNKKLIKKSISATYSTTWRMLNPDSFFILTLLSIFFIGFTLVDALTKVYAERELNFNFTIGSFVYFGVALLLVYYKNISFYNKNKNEYKKIITITRLSGFSGKKYNFINILSQVKCSTCGIETPSVSVNNIKSVVIRIINISLLMFSLIILFYSSVSIYNESYDNKNNVIVTVVTYLLAHFFIFQLYYYEKSKGFIIYVLYKIAHFFFLMFLITGFVIVFGAIKKLESIQIDMVYFVIIGCVGFFILQYMKIKYKCSVCGTNNYDKIKQ